MKIIISRTVKYLEDKIRNVTKDRISNKNNKIPKCDNLQLKLELIEDNTDNARNTTQNQNANLDATQNVPRISNMPNSSILPDRFAFLGNNVKIEHPKSCDDIKPCKFRLKRKRG